MSIEARKTKAGKTRYLARVRSGTQLVASRTFDRKSDAMRSSRQVLEAVEAGQQSASAQKRVEAKILQIRHSQQVTPDQVMAPKIEPKLYLVVEETLKRYAAAGESMLVFLPGIAEIQVI